MVITDSNTAEAPLFAKMGLHLSIWLFAQTFGEIRGKNTAFVDFYIADNKYNRDYALHKNIK